MSEIGGRVGNKEGVRSVEEMASAKPQITDHLARARARTAQIKAINGDLDLNETFVDKWWIEPPEGWSYEWKTHSVFNKEYPQYISTLQRNGWAPVPRASAESLLYPEYEGDSTILEGMMLMERPKELTDQVRQVEYRRAVEVVRASEKKLSDAPAGTAPRNAHPETTPRVRSHTAPLGIE